MPEAAAASEWALPVFCLAGGLGFAVGYVVAQWTAIGLIRRHLAELRRIAAERGGGARAGAGLAGRRRDL
jgi:hypothetical protein